MSVSFYVKGVGSSHRVSPCDCTFGNCIGIDDRLWRENVDAMYEKRGLLNDPDRLDKLSEDDWEVCRKESGYCCTESHEIDCIMFWNGETYFEREEQRNISAVDFSNGREWLKAMGYSGGCPYCSKCNGKGYKEYDIPTEFASFSNTYFRIFADYVGISYDDDLCGEIKDGYGKLIYRKLMKLLNDIKEIEFNLAEENEDQLKDTQYEGLFEFSRDVDYWQIQIKCVIEALREANKRSSYVFFC